MYAINCKKAFNNIKSTLHFTVHVSTGMEYFRELGKWEKTSQPTYEMVETDLNK